MNTLKLEKIEGIEVALYMNKLGGCWFFSFGGKTYGAYINKEHEDTNEILELMRKNATETLKTLL